MAPVVLIAEELAPAALDVLADDFDVRHVDGTDRPALFEALADADAVIVRSATDIDAEAIAADLEEDGLVLRYKAEEGLNADGLEGEEGTFVICSFWLVSCLAKAGEVERAEALFARLAGHANDLGLLGEEIDTATGEQLGNFRQAYSHIGLITAAWEIDQAKARR